MKLKLLLLSPLVFLLFAGASLAADSDDWFKHFYLTQDITKFPAFWENIVKDKSLENDDRVAPLIGFTSQVLHQHPELLKGRFDNIQQYPEKQRKMVLTILWLSNTKEADAILEKQSDADFAGKAPPPIGTHPFDDPSDLDFCWGYYFATGDTDALIPIVSALDFAKYMGAVDRYKTSQKTEEDRSNALKDAIFKVAMWSLGANAGEDKKIAAYLDKTYEDPHTPYLRKLCLRQILTKLFPKKYEETAPGDKMTKVVYHAVDPGIKPGSFASKPKTLYELGVTRGRLEEQPDPDMQLQELIISNGPDVWMINLWDKSGRHMIDAGPTYNFFAPIVPPTEENKPPKVKDFMMGKELSFMSGKGIKPVPGVFEGQKALVYECKEQGLTLKVYASPKTHLPVGVSVEDGGKQIVKLVYDEYSNSLAPDETLFQPPEGTMISEGK